MFSISMPLNAERSTMSVLSSPSASASGMRRGRERASILSLFKMDQVSDENRSRTTEAMPRSRPKIWRALPGRSCL